MDKKKVNYEILKNKIYTKKYMIIFILFSTSEKSKQLVNNLKSLIIKE